MLLLPPREARVLRVGVVVGMAVVMSIMSRRGLLLLLLLWSSWLGGGELRECIPIYLS